jgi:DNA-binding MarR family transcriptional regulator
MNNALGQEARATSADHNALRTWLRLLSCSRQIENEIRARLRDRFEISLARFDYLAQLHRAPSGLSMREITQRLMVTGGNVTGLTNELAAEGYVTRKPNPNDGRGTIISLSAKGRRGFETMAKEHEAWVIELLAGLPTMQLAAVHAHLGALRQHIHQKQNRKACV